MRKVYYCLLGLIIPASLYAQSEFTFLEGIQNGDGQTYLITRSGPVDTTEPSFRFDLRARRQIDILPQGNIAFNEDLKYDIAFWDNDPQKYLHLEDVDLHRVRIRDFRGNMFERPKFGETQRLIISKSDPQIVYHVNGGYTFVSKDSGLTIADTLIYPLLAVHPENNALLYAASPNNRLLFSNDSGKTFFKSDDNKIWSSRFSQIAFDKDGKHVFAWTRTEDEAFLMRSDDQGKPFSWSITKRHYVGTYSYSYIGDKKLYLYSPLRIAIDDSSSGKWYFSLGRNIYKSEDFGQSFSYLRSLSYKITGLFVGNVPIIV